MRASRIAVLPVALLLSGCIDGLSPSSERTGFISASTVDLGGGTNFGLTFVGAFYRFDGLEVGLGVPEVCLAYIYSPEPLPTGIFPTIDAGDRLITLISGSEDTLLKTNRLGVETYQLPSSIGSVPMTPGDTLTVEIPGTLKGFPATTIKIRTSEPYTVDPVGTVSEGEELPLTWTAAPAPGSLMLFYLRYSSLSTSDIPNTEIRCAFTDDGAGTVNVELTAAWLASSPASREIVTQRARLTTTEIDAKTRVSLISFFDRPLPFGSP